MSTDLREELHALARTQTFSPDPSTWDRGRRARRRDRALAAVAVLVVLASATGLAFSLQPDREARTAATRDVVDVGVGAIPRRIDDIAADLRVTTDLGIGRGAAAFVSTSQRAPVVVTATDGVAHRLDLPGWTEDAQSLALSPDGLRLAWHDRSAGGATISVLELLTGKTWSHQVHPDGDLSLRELSWSPDSVWLAWIADADGGAHVGRLRPVHAPMPLSWFVNGNIPSVAVGPRAQLVVSRPNGGMFVLAGAPEPEQLVRADGVGVGLFSPDGRFVALRSSPSGASSTLRASDGAVLTHPFPDGTDTAAVLPLGWLDDRHQVLQLWSAEGEDVELVVATPQVGQRSTWRRSVGSIDARIAGRVSVAVDLMPDLDGTSSQELTHDFPPVSAQDAGPGRVPYVLGGLVALLAGLAVVRMVRRKRV